MKELKVIWLQPWCDECEAISSRDWCADDVWGKCAECDERSVKYILEEAQP